MYLMVFRIYDLIIFISQVVWFERYPSFDVKKFESRFSWFKHNIPETLQDIFTNFITHIHHTNVHLMYRYQGHRSKVKVRKDNYYFWCFSLLASLFFMLFKKSFDKTIYTLFRFYWYARFVSNLVSFRVIRKRTYLFKYWTLKMTKSLRRASARCPLCSIIN